MNKDLKKILVTDKITSEAMISLSQQSFCQVEKSAFYDLHDSDLSDVHGLLIRSRTPIDESILSRAPKLQVITCMTSGFDHIDLKACQKWGITVMHTPSANIESASELAWSLILCGARHIISNDQQARKGSWKDTLPKGLELSQKHLGVIGLGRIGSRVAQIGGAFGMKILAYDPFQSESTFLENKVERSSLEELLIRSDVVSLHVPLTRLTKGMIGRSQFEIINSQSILVNTSRGGVINEQDLVQALERKPQLTIAMDVFENEPLKPQSPLTKLPQVIISPHTGAHTDEALAKASEDGVLKMIRFFIDGSTSDTLPPKADWFV